jgi:hypothetical protein
MSAVDQTAGRAAGVLVAGHLPMALSCLIQRSAFFFALMAA